MPATDLPGYIWRIDASGQVLEECFFYTDSTDSYFWLQDPSQAVRREGRNPPSSNLGSAQVAEMLRGLGGGIPCQSALPEGWRWIGSYVPVANAVFPCGTSRMVAVADSTKCPHCAIAIGAPSIIVAGTEGDGQYGLLRPEVAGEPVRTPSNYAETIKAGAIGLCCSTCGFPGHNSRNCNNLFKFYDKVGIEIEGRWVDSSAVSRRANEEWEADVTGDGSIAGSLATRAQSREIRTKPGTISHAVKQLLDLYPDEADYSCGMHVHVSFADPLYLTQLMTKEFFEYFRARWATWGEAQGFLPTSNFFRRLRGGNSYCKINTPNPNPFSVDRYRQLNFSSYSVHKTLECRLLPMFRDSRHAVAAVVELMSMIYDWLTMAASEQLLPAAVLMPDALAIPAVFETDAKFEVDDYRDFNAEATHTLVIDELPPVPADHRRVALSRDRLANLRAMGLDLTEMAA